MKKRVGNRQKKALRNPVEKKKSKKVPAARVRSKKTARKSEVVLKAAVAALNEPMKIEEVKYYTGAPAYQPEYRKSIIQELEGASLPGRYDEDVIVAQIRDPWWVYVYWDLSSSTVAGLRKKFGSDFEKSRWLLRSYDVSFIEFNGNNAHRFFDVSVDVDTRNWYLDLASPGTSWCIDLGFLLPDGRFITVLRSNVISMPLDGPSWITDEQWLIPDDEFRRLYGLSIGMKLGATSPIGKLWRERLKKDVTSFRSGSGGMSSPVKKGKKKQGFWMVVDAELIVYGATEPDAKVTVQGRPISLRKDGTFTLRFALPDGRQVIPVEGTSAKTGEKRRITPIVTRKTTNG